MSLSVQQQVKYWGIGLAVLALFLWYVGDTLLPFLIGAAIAYLLDPLADRLESWGLSRTWATVVISLVVLVLSLLALLLVVPLIVGQVRGLVEAAPNFLTTTLDFLTERFPGLLDQNSPIRQNLAAIEATVRANSGQVISQVLSSSLAVVNSLTILIVAPVVAFYLLLDWDRMVAVVDGWLPREHAPVIRKLGRDIDNVLAGFVRGQMTVGLILGIFYAVALGIIGLQFGVVVGLLAGLLTFIPYVGSTFGGVTSIGLALFQFWDDPVWIAVVAAVFVLGQVVEGNFLTPKLVGGSVGLHPVWLMFALFAFGSALGFVGLLIAVPAAASIGVLGRFAIANYKQSKLYLGPEDPETDETDNAEA